MGLKGFKEGAAFLAEKGLRALCVAEGLRGCGPEEIHDVRYALSNLEYAMPEGGLNGAPKARLPDPPNLPRGERDNCRHQDSSCATVRILIVLGTLVPHGPPPPQFSFGLVARVQAKYVQRLLKTDSMPKPRPQRAPGFIFGLNYLRNPKLSEV